MFRYYLFRSWGRIGTTIGGSKTEDFGHDLSEAKEEFERYKSISCKKGPVI